MAGLHLRLACLVENERALAIGANYLFVFKDDSEKADLQMILPGKEHHTTVDRYSDPKTVAIVGRTLSNLKMLGGLK